MHKIVIPDKMHNILHNQHKSMHGCTICNTLSSAVTSVSFVVHTTSAQVKCTDS